MLRLILALIVRSLFRTAPGISPGQIPGNLDAFWREMDYEALLLKRQPRHMKYIRIESTNPSHSGPELSL